MLSDAQANNVMEVITSIGEYEARGHEDAMLMLQHLYELHKLRDRDIYNDVAFQLIEDFEHSAFKLHQEMHDA